ncbi:MAG: MmgE/PrpD family protein [Desulfuromonadales bacterium]|nr:MmgE/PrpD family protein [Desulfuromonadales bacterium]
MVIENFIVELTWDSLPERTQQAARLCVLDAIGCAIAGSRSAGLPKLIEKICRHDISGRSPVWGTVYKTELSWSIFFNSHSAAYFDLDDGHRRAQGHPGAAVVPACLAVAQQRNCTAKEFLASVVVGYEVAIRSALVMRALGGPRKGSGGWTTTGVAAAVARLMKLEKQQVKAALGLAEYYAPQATQDRSASYPSDMKEGIPWGAYTGYTAAILAGGGLGAMRPHLSDSPEAEDLGKNYEIENSYFKTYASCRWAHPALDGLKQMLSERGACHTEIEEIRIRTFEKAALMDRHDPEGCMAAVYSIPYAVACFLRNGVLGPAQLSGDMFVNQEISALSKRVRLVVDDDLTYRFPEQCLQKLEVDFKDGTRYVSGLLSAKGDPSDPYSYHELLEKFQSLTENVIGEQWLNVAEFIAEMDGQSVEELVKMLTP